MKIKTLVARLVDLLRIKDPYALQGPTVIRAKPGFTAPRTIRIHHDQFVVKR